MIIITNLYAFLEAFSTLRVACRNDIYRQSKLSMGTVNRCLIASIQAELITGTAGDLRKHNYMLTEDGKLMVGLLKRMILL